jgi:hypothetical protein
MALEAWCRRLKRLQRIMSVGDYFLILSCGYSVRDAYHLLTTMDPPGEDTTSDLIWNKQVPLKVLVLAWGSYATGYRQKTIWWGVTSFLMTLSCVCVWLRQIGNNTSCVPFLPCFCPLVAHGKILDWNLLSWSKFITGPFCLAHSFLQLIWLCCIWVMWNERNNRVFKAKEATTRQMLDTVKVYSFWWLKAYVVNLDLNSHMW